MADRRYEYQMKVRILLHSCDRVETGKTIFTCCMLLQAQGGSEMFVWTMDDPAIANVDPSTGLVRSGETIGKTILTAKDHRNPLHSATAEVGSSIFVY
jgi:hypothetical protein